MYRTMEIETIQYENMQLNDPVCIIGFPSIGLVSSIMANTYVTNLKMTPIAGLISSNMPPYCLIQDDKPLPPVRFFAYKNKRKEGRDVIVCMSEHTPKPEDCYLLASKILGYAKSKGCKTVICLDGSPKYGDNDKTLVVGDGPESEKLIKKSKLTKMKGGMLRGLSGVLMVLAPSKGMSIVSVLVPATSGVPDPGASVDYIDPVSRMVPGFKTNTKELLKEAQIIDRQVQEQQQNGTDTSQYIG